MSVVLSRGLEENILCALGWAEPHATAIALQVTPDLFSTRHYRQIAKACIQYIEKYRLPPRIHLRDVFEEAKGDEAAKIHATLTEMERLAPELHIEYVVAELDKFIEARLLAHAIEEASDLLDSGKPTEARERLHQIGTRHVDSDGIWLDDPEQSLSYLNGQAEEAFGTGIGALDKLGIGPRRKRLLVFLAELGRGKSWFLVGCGKQALLEKHRVLHITLEMPDLEVAQRYVQSLFSMTTEQAEQVQITRLDNRNGTLSVEIENLNPDRLSPENRKRVEKRMRGLRYLPRLKIKAFSGNTLSGAKLQGYLDTLERVHQFRPDLLLVDYGDLMHRHVNLEMRHSIGQNFADLHTIAQERDIAVVSPTQANRAGSAAKLMTRRFVGEDWSKLQTADIVLTYSQTEEERRIRLARIFVDKARWTRDQQTVLISQAYSVGQFALDSIVMSRKTAEELKRGTDDADTPGGD